MPSKRKVYFPSLFHCSIIISWDPNDLDWGGKFLACATDRILVYSSWRALLTLIKALPPTAVSSDSGIGQGMTAHASSLLLSPAPLPSPAQSPCSKSPLASPKTITLVDDSTKGGG